MEWNINYADRALLGTRQKVLNAGRAPYPLLGIVGRGVNRKSQPTWVALSLSGHSSHRE